MKFLRLFVVGGFLASNLVLAAANRLPSVRTVFVIVLENTSWANVKGNPSAPYLNQTLLPIASHCEQYYCPSNNHPSLPNYLWLEAGANFGILNDGWPAANHVNTTNHLVSQLELAGISWRAYAEDIDGAQVPLQDTNNYAVRHDPFVYFDDITGTNNPQYSYAIAHIRPYPELAGDLDHDSVARYNFIIPNLIHDGHDVAPPESNTVQQSDDWLAIQMPLILQSAAYSNNGAVFILWDEGSGGSDGPIGLLLLSPQGRGGGYVSSVRHTHSDTLRTLQEIFGLQPWLGDAAHSGDLSELFSIYSLAGVDLQPDHTMKLTLVGTAPGQTNVLQCSGNLADWTNLSTNVALASQLIFRVALSNDVACFYRSYVVP